MSTEHDDVMSPPYPTMVATTTNMYRILYALREWTIVQINQLKADEALPPSKAEELTYPDKLPVEASWDVVSIVDHYAAFMYTRRIRETWDAILREHELDWDSKLCLKKRFYLVQTALHVLQEAFVDPATREERYKNSFQEVDRQMKMMAKALRTMITPPEHRDEVEEDGPLPEDDEGW